MSRTNPPQVNMEPRTAEPTPLEYGARRYPLVKVKLGLPPWVSIAMIVCGSAILIAPWIFGTSVMRRFMPPGSLENVFQLLYPWGTMAAGATMIGLGFFKSLRPTS